MPTAYSVKHVLKFGQDSSVEGSQQSLLSEFMVRALHNLALDEPLHPSPKFSILLYYNSILLLLKDISPFIDKYR